MDSGVKTTSVSASDLADEVLGNYQGSTVRIAVARLAALLSAMTGPAYATRAQLYADLSWPAGATGHVHGDPDPALTGTYKKSGNPGAGSWTRIGELPTGTVGQALLAAETEARRVATADGGVLRLTNVGGTADAATAELAPGVADIGIRSSLLLFYVPIATNTVSGPTLTIAGVTRELRIPGSGPVGAGEMVAGSGYLLKVQSTTVLHLLGGGASAAAIAEAVAGEAAARGTAIAAAIEGESAARVAALGEINLRMGGVEATAWYPVFNATYVAGQILESGSLLWGITSGDYRLEVAGKPIARLDEVDALSADVDTRLAALPLPASLLGDARKIAIAWRAESGAVFGGFREDGAFFSGGAPLGAEAVTLPSGAAALALDNGRVIRIGWGDVLTGPMQYKTAAMGFRAGTLRFVHDLGAAGHKVDAMDVSFSWPLAPAFTQIQPYLFYGQSLALEQNADAALTGEVAPGRALMYDTANSPSMSVVEASSGDKSDFGTSHYPNTDLARMVSLREVTGESPASAAAGALLPGLSASTGLVLSNHARAGWGMSGLVAKDQSSGHGIQYAGILRAAAHTRAFCDVHGRTMLQPVMSFIHGEADAGMFGYVYRDYLEKLQVRLTADLSLITGRSDQVSIALCQTSKIDHGGSGSLGQTVVGAAVRYPVAAAQLQVALDHPDRFICVGPKYHLERRLPTDGTHLSAVSSKLWGEYHGRALRSGQLPLHVSSYSRSGAVITLGVSGGDGSGLVVDTVQVSDPGNLGIQWWDNTASPRNVLSVNVSGRTIIVTLTGDPGVLGGAVRGVLGIGLKQTVEGDYGPSGGNRTSIRDSCPDLSTQGLPMQNWLCHDRFIEGDDTFTPRP
ncbi:MULTISPECIES: hypothetical protein [Frigidibacter]|uniref:Uncharacterized protein n=1 Tax=Frigidibacter mobilis TaxID=1335048 RepID=A0A159Z5T3_9RHOB|nr:MULTISPECIES: hypothetical protein [Frigidibacter]AMY69800.1 hypothetical protein AKL17_2557 [Frigidibacter mobilis]MDP3340458.1 hypothetical protein [Frigidibacter sp.]